MGSGDRFWYGRQGGFGFGFFYSKFPFNHTFSLSIGFWCISVGFGKAYGE